MPHLPAVHTAVLTASGLSSRPLTSGMSTSGSETEGIDTAGNSGTVPKEVGSVNAACAAPAAVVLSSPAAPAPRCFSCLGRAGLAPECCARGARRVLLQATVEVAWAAIAGNWPVHRCVSGVHRAPRALVARKNPAGKCKAGRCSRQRRRMEVQPGKSDRQPWSHPAPNPALRRAPGGRCRRQPLRQSIVEGPTGC